MYGNKKLEGCNLLWNICPRHLRLQKPSAPSESPALRIILGLVLCLAQL